MHSPTTPTAAAGQQSALPWLQAQARLHSPVAFLQARETSSSWLHTLLTPRPRKEQLARELSPPVQDRLSSQMGPDPLQCGGRDKSKVFVGCIKVGQAAAQQQAQAHGTRQHCMQQSRWLQVPQAQPINTADSCLAAAAYSPGEAGAGEVGRAGGGEAQLAASHHRLALGEVIVADLRYEQAVQRGRDR